MDDEIEKKFTNALKPVLDGQSGLTTELESLKSKLDETAHRMDKLEVETQTKGKDFVEPGPKMEYKDVFIKALRGQFLTSEERSLLLNYPQEQKLMTVANNETGLYLAPLDMWREILKTQTQFSPFRSLSRVTQINGPALKIPKKLTTGTAVWVDEISTRADTGNPTYDMINIPTHEISSVSLVSQQNLEDTAFDLVGEIQMDQAERMRILEDTSFLTGDGVGKPRGLLKDPACIAAHLKSADADNFTMDDIKRVFYTLKPGYRNNAVWMMNNLTGWYIDNLKTVLTGEYSWRPANEVGRPDMLMGRPVVYNPDMVAPVAGVYTSMDIPIVFGDFRAGYLIVDKVGMSMQRDDITKADVGQVKFIGRKRVGGQVIMPEAFQLFYTEA
jgi:HK97 family phage major capsid protein